MNLNSTELFGQVSQFRLANNNILVNANGVSFSGNNLQLGNSFTVDGLGATVNGDLLSVGNSLSVDGLGATVSGDLLSVGNSLSADASGLTVVGDAFSVGNHFTVSDAKTVVKNELLVEGRSITVSDGVANQFRVTPGGVVRSRRVRVDLDPIPDYVFEPDYDLISIEALEAYIKENGHLPNIKSASEYGAIGYIDLGELEVKLLEKIEEQTLYTIELKKELNAIKAQLERLSELLDEK